MPSDRVIHIVDDDAAVRRTLARLLGAAGFTVHDYKGGRSLLDAVESLSEGCILTDMRMPGMDGFELQRRLAECGVRLPIIVMTGQGDVATAVRAMKAGAFDFIEKPFSDDLLLATIDAALATGNQPDGETADEKSRHESHEAAARIAALSPREREVLEAIVAGRLNKTIAHDLGVSVRTIEVHRAHLMARLGVRQVAGLVRLALLARRDGA
jgi:two-component system, LuxR family, response regulator FixJ